MASTWSASTPYRRVTFGLAHSTCSWPSASRSRNSATGLTSSTNSSRARAASVSAVARRTCQRSTRLKPSKASSSAMPPSTAAGSQRGSTVCGGGTIAFRIARKYTESGVCCHFRSQWSIRASSAACRPSGAATNSAVGLNRIGVSSSPAARPAYAA